jgi:DNA-binding HxlR family transcriptional regulator
MTKYGQFCPVAKSAEIIGNPWSLLIVRELLLGSSRFSLLQKGLPRISPTVLNTRLKELEEHGVLVKRRLTGLRGHEYRLTPAGRELSAVIEALAVWGMRWARDKMNTDDLDVTSLMFDIQRRIDTGALPDPGKDVDCHICATSRNLIGVWMGDLPLATALRSEAIQLTGERHLCRAFSKWFRLSALAKTPRPAARESLTDPVRR